MWTLKQIIWVYFGPTRVIFRLHIRHAQFGYQNYPAQWLARYFRLSEQAQISRYFNRDGNFYLSCVWMRLFLAIGIHKYILCTWYASLLTKLCGSVAIIGIEQAMKASSWYRSHRSSVIILTTYNLFLSHWQTNLSFILIKIDRIIDVRYWRSCTGTATVRKKILTLNTFPVHFELNSSKKVWKLRFDLLYST